MKRKLKFWNGSHDTSSKSRRKKSSRLRRGNSLRSGTLGMELLEDRRVLSAGSLDPTFNPSGSPQGVLVADLGFLEEGQSIAVQADGKLLVAGTVETPGSGAGSQNFAVARFLADGQLDTTFGVGGSDGVDGLATIDFFNGQDIAHDMLIDSLGRIVVVGQGRDSGGGSSLAVARMNSDGTLDSTFGTGGKFLQNIGGMIEEPRSVALQSDGKLVVAGNARTGGSSTSNFFVGRVHVNGGLDTSFNGTGFATTDFNSSLDQGYDVAVQSDGRIVVGGVVTTSGVQQFGLARYNTNGTLDSGFGVSGRVRTDILGLGGGGSNSDTIKTLAVDEDGKIVVGGNTSSTNFSDAIVARYNVDGTLDTSFNSSDTQPGVLRVHLSTRDFIEGLAIQPDGEYVFVGSSATVSGVFPSITTDSSLLVMRVLDTAGQPDHTFGTGGITLVDLAAGNSDEDLRDVAIQPNGTIVAGGIFNTDFVLARFDSGLAPAPSISGDSDVDEGATYTLNLSYAEPSTAQWTINWGDSVEVVSGNPASVTHVYADGDANYTISATAITDNGTIAAENTVMVMVHNVAPTVAISGSANADEGATYTLDLSAVDPGDDTITSWTINWGDSIEVVSGNPASVTHTYADGDADYTISATATDEDGTWSASSTVEVNVNDVAPTLAISGAATVDEGSLYTLDLSSFDPGDDTITSWTINWGDSIEVVTGNPVSVTHTYADGDANYTISATATDEDGTWSAGNSVDAAVVNVAPALTISGAADADEGSSYTLNLSSFDVGDDTITNWTINWGDGIEVISGNPTSVSHTYADGVASYTITATATDEDGTYAAGNEVDVTVHNVAPTLTINGAASVDEGAAYILDLSSMDAGNDTITSWTINWGDSVEVVSGNPASVTHAYADGDANFVITATAADEDGTYSAGNSVSVAVHNVAPTLTISGAANVTEGSSYTLNLSSSDPGDDTITSWTINWGDGTETVTGNPTSVSHTYADGDASYTITATATDEDGSYAAANTVSVAVLNAAPTLTLSGVSDVDEGSSYTLNLSAFDPGEDTITSWTINWGDSVEVVTGNPTSVTHTYADGDANYTITATATDEDGTYAAANDIAVTVHNVDPTADAGGPYFTFDDTPITLSGTGSDVAGAADPLMFDWDLDDNGSFETSGASVTFDPVALGYTGTQTRTVKLRVSDGDGGTAVATTTVELLGEGAVVIGGVLHIVGSNTENDIVVINKVNDDLQVIATFNDENPVSFDYSAVNEIQVRTRGGHDIVVTTPNVEKPMTIDGGSGNDLLIGGGGENLLLGGTGNDVLMGDSGEDVLKGGDGNDDLFGGGGNDILVGGNGSDILDGGQGRDLLIGSQDEDLLHGGNDDDILIGGFTSHDDNLAALDAIMAIWGSSDSFDSRVDQLTESGGLLEPGIAVFDDDDMDLILGGAGRDLIFGDTNPWDGSIDLILLKSRQDVLVAVN